jgi:putative pyrroloquinoline-quinone binding quinoprotein
MRSKECVWCQRKTRFLAFAWLAVLFGPAANAREKKTLQRTATDVQAKAGDTCIEQDLPTAINGNATFLCVQSQSGNVNRRSLVLFDFSSLPNVGVKSAVLTLQVTSAPASSRTYDAHRVTSLFLESTTSWNKRVDSLSWSASGGDFIGSRTSSAVIDSSSASAAWDITSDVQAWFNGTPNYGTVIKDDLENSSGDFTTFASMEDSTEAHRPKLDIYFVQNAQNLLASGGNNSISLSWSFPPAIGSVIEPNVGVLILRRANQPVDASSVPTDATDPGLCTTIGSAAVVFDDSTGATSFTDNSSDTCGAPTNGTTWFYKVFLRDSANNYSSNGTGRGGFGLEASSRPDASAPAQPEWVEPTQSAMLAAPAAGSTSPVMIGTQTGILAAVSPSGGDRPYPSVSLGAAVTGRSPAIDSGDSSTGVDVLYAADQSGLIYAINMQSGAFLWVANPTGADGSGFRGAGAVLVKSFSSQANTRSTDLYVVGTRNSSTTTANQLVGLDGNTGATVWKIVGNTNGAPPLDIISSTPMIDYTCNAIWFSSRSAAGASQPSLWKIDANSGSVLATANLGDIDSSPTLTTLGDVLFVSNNAGTLFAVNPADGTALGSIDTGDGAIQGFPVPENSQSPFQIAFSASSTVQLVTFDSSTKTFSRVWRTPISSPSAPIGFQGLTKIYVGSTDGKIHELDAATGTDSKQRIVNTGLPAIIGDPSIDVSRSLIYVSTTDQRTYAFAFPF